MWPFKKKRKIVGYKTEFQSLTWYNKMCSGEISFSDYSRLGAEDLKAIKIPIYEDETEGDK